MQVTGDAVRWSIRLIVAALATLATFFAAQAGVSHEFPNRPLRIVAPFPPGGAVDFVARLLANRLRDRFNQPIIVENITGATGQIGVEAVAKAIPDGYSTVLAASAAVSINVHLGKLSYDPLKDLAFITKVVVTPSALAVSSSLPVRNLTEFIDYVKARPGQVSYAVSGVGSQLHLAGELLKNRTGLDMVAVSYKGTLPSTAAVAQGEVQAAVSDLTTLLPHAAADRVRILAVVDATRSVAAPDVPTVAESGVTGFVASGWLGLFTTGGTPPEIVHRWNSEVNAVLANPEVRHALVAAGVEADTQPSPEKASAFLRAEIARWGQAIKESNINLRQGN